MISSPKKTRRRTGLRVIAAFEAVKGLLGLAVVTGVLSFIHKDLHAAALSLVKHLHLNPANHYSKYFIESAEKITDGNLWVLAGLAIIYAGFRFLEAYGLWRKRQWAEWMGLISSMIYFPFEIYELTTGITFLKVGALTINLLVTLYFVWDLYLIRKSH